jgi:FkbM family methyltransferase
MFFVIHLLRDTDVFADVGANIGSYTILAAGVCGAKTYSFEPCLKTYERLCDNVAINSLFRRVNTLNMAVGASKGVVKFTQSCGTMNHVVDDPNVGGNVAEVVVETLDEVLRDDVPSVLKIDVEGYETEVINGADQILSSDKCNVLIMEFGVGNRYGYNEEALFNKVVGYGFTPCKYDPFSRTLTVKDKNEMASSIYVKNYNEVRMRLKEADMQLINGQKF